MRILLLAAALLTGCASNIGAQSPFESVTRAVFRGDLKPKPCPDEDVKEARAVNDDNILISCAYGPLPDVQLALTPLGGTVTPWKDLEEGYSLAIADVPGVSVQLIYTLRTGQLIALGMPEE